MSVSGAILCLHQSFNDNISNVKHKTVLEITLENCHGPHCVLTQCLTKALNLQAALVLETKVSKLKRAIFVMLQSCAPTTKKHQMTSIEGEDHICQCFPCIILPTLMALNSTKRAASPLDYTDCAHYLVEACKERFILKQSRALVARLRR